MPYVRGQGRGVPVHAFKYDEDNFIVRTALRKSKGKKLWFMKTEDTCQITKSRTATDPTLFSAQLNVVLAAVHRVIIKISHEDAMLKNAPLRNKRIKDRTSRMRIRLKPNFLHDGGNF